MDVFTVSKQLYAIAKTFPNHFSNFWLIGHIIFETESLQFVEFKIRSRFRRQCVFVEFRGHLAFCFGGKPPTFPAAILGPFWANKAFVNKNFVKKLQHGKTYNRIGSFLFSPVFSGSLSMVLSEFGASAMQGLPNELCMKQ